MVSTLSWKEVFSFNHNLEELDDNNSSSDVNIYVESETKEEGPLYEAVSKPFKIPKISPSYDKLECSNSGYLQVTREALSYVILIVTFAKETFSMMLP